jgi:hypothetical protein
LNCATIFCHFHRDGFQELVGQLNPNDPDSEVDKVVKFILDQNILVRHLNVQVLTASFIAVDAIDK